MVTDIQKKNAMMQGHMGKDKFVRLPCQGFNKTYQVGQRIKSENTLNESIAITNQ